MRFSRAVVPCLCVIVTLACNRVSQRAQKASDDEAIRQEIAHLRDLPDAKRRIVTQDLALRIQRLPAAPSKVTLAASLTNLSTEGDFGRDTLQAVSTDHCPFCMKEQKELGKNDFTKIPNGGPGVEHRLSLIYSGGVHGGKFSANRFVQLVSTAPAKLFGLYPRKGTIAVGSDADIVIFDPNAEQVISVKTHHMRVDYSMFEGMRVKGVTKTVLSRGRVIIENGTFTGRPGAGEFLRRQTYSGAG